MSALLLGTSSLKKPSLNRRGTAELFEISQRARLVQSFVADPSAPVPRIWQQRLGPTAAPDRWARHARGLWWLIWLEDGEPLLALPAVSHSSSLDLLFADELHRCSFNQLPPLKRREPSALEQSCLQRLTSGTSVQWQPTGLASISGSLSPALASVSHGCLRVALQGDRLLAEGPVAPSPFASLQTHHRNTQPISFVSIRVCLSGAQQRFPAAAAGILVQQFTVRTTTRQPIRTAEGGARRSSQCTCRCTARCARGWLFPGFNSGQVDAGC